MALTRSIPAGHGAVKDLRAETEEPMRTIQALTKYYSCLFLVSLTLLLTACQLYPTSPSDELRTTNVPQSASHVERISQFDRSQYASEEEYQQWSPSTCSTTTMAEMGNYLSPDGKRYRITDILHLQIQAHAISAELGLLDNKGIARTLAPLHLHVDYTSRTLDQVIDLAKHGHPVIVDFPPDRWAGGHILLVTGGNSSQVELVDSSQLNLRTMSRSNFMKYWAGFVAVVTPEGGQS